MSTGDRNALNVLGEHHKATTTGATNRVRLAALRGYLRGLPSLDFTAKGLANICARHRVSPDELAAAVAELQARPGRPTPELLRTIGTAVGDTHRAPTKEGTRLC